MFDRRFPYLFRPEEIPHATPEERSSLSGLAARVFARTDFRMVYNARSGKMFFYIKEPQQGAAIPSDLSRFRVGPRAYDMGIVDRADDICRVLQSGRMSSARKDQLSVWADNARKSDERSRIDREVRPEQERIVREEFARTRDQWRMGRTFKKSVLVNGLKGGV